jgi:hypothetical protein
VGQRGEEEAAAEELRVERERGGEAAAVAAERRGRAERSREEEEREGRGQVAEEEAVVEELRVEIVGGEGSTKKSPPHDGPIWMQCKLGPHIIQCDGKVSYESFLHEHNFLEARQSW